MVPCGFNLYFSNDVEHILMRLVAIYISSSVKYLIKSFCWFLKLGCFFSHYCFESSQYILNESSLSDTWSANIFFLFSRLSFYSVDGFLRHAEAFQCDEVPLVYFRFCCFCFWRQIQNIIANTCQGAYHLYFF